jgi:hypothetical protein
MVREGWRRRLDSVSRQRWSSTAGEGINEVLHLEEGTREVRDHLAEEKVLRRSSSPWGKNGSSGSSKCGEEWRRLGHRCRRETEVEERGCPHMVEGKKNGERKWGTAARPFYTSARRWGTVDGVAPRGRRGLRESRGGGPTPSSGRCLAGSGLRPAGAGGVARPVRIGEGQGG